MKSKRNKATNRRGQTPKTRTGGKVVKSGNPDYVRGMQELRRSSATTPVPSGTRYVRKTRNNTIPEA